MADDVMAVANLIAAATGAARLASPTRRPILFVANVGRPGAEHFISQLKDRTVSVIHLEGSPSRTSVQPVLGLDRSSLEEVVRAAAQADGVLLGVDGDTEADFFASGASIWGVGSTPALDFRPESSPRTGRLALRIGWAVANSSQFPAWLPGLEPSAPPKRVNPR
jgi:hypothetical protein